MNALMAYFERIHYNEVPKVDLRTLKQLHQLHPKYIPFENLDSLNQKHISLKISNLIDKLIIGKRGGYCFEQNGLFKYILTQIGFDVTGLSGRVLWNMDPAIITTRTHMLLLIKLDGQQYIADVGFGAMTLTSPLLFVTDLVQETRHGTFKIVKKDVYYILHVLKKGLWLPVYQFYTDVAESIDYEVGNWYVSTHPDSHFIRDLVVAKVDDDGRYAMNNNVLTIRYDNGEKKSMLLKNSQEIIDTLERLFGIRTADIIDLKKLLTTMNWKAVLVLVLFMSLTILSSCFCQFSSSMSSLYWNL